MWTTAVNSAKVIAIGGLVLLCAVLGSRWVNRQRPADAENGTRTIRIENARTLGSAEPSESAPIALQREVSATPPTRQVSALERLALITASQPSSRQGRVRTSAPGKPVSASSPTPSGKEPIQDPVAREALFYVGADPEAEEYWLDAINDPSLPAEERQDLIEDLNEDGLPDPRFPTPDDLPLILRRIELIEAVGLDAMDEVNADAFEEAYKDLVNLKDVAMGGGRPVN